MAATTLSGPRAAGGRLESGLGQRTTTERVDRGKAARAAVPRESHAVFDPPPDRPDPVDQLQEQSASRVPELVPIRYGRMLVSPFAYFRGAALPMASDLASLPTSGIVVQACGDAHLSNFGVFASPERNLVFDVNDFDETLPGPWEWDVKRLAASLEVAGRGNGFSGKQRRGVVMATVRRYRQSMRDFAGMNSLDVWYARADLDRVEELFPGQVNARARKTMAKDIAKARTRDSMQAFSKLCGMVNGQPRFIADPPLIVPLSHLMGGRMRDAEVESQLRTVLTRYTLTIEPDRRFLLQRYEFADIAHKVVGVGSVGTRCWIVLLLERDQSTPLIMQVKEASQSVLAPYTRHARHANQGQRVVQGQRLIQASSDIFLGWHRTGDAPGGPERDYYVRQLRDWKFSLDIDAMSSRDMQGYGELCAWTLSRAHARSGDSIAIAAYLGNSDVFDRAITEFAAAYADQNERDYEALVEAAATDRVIAERDMTSIA